MTLARGLEKELNRIDRKVQQLINEPVKPGEKPVLELFPELSELTESQSD